MRNQKHQSPSMKEVQRIPRLIFFGVSKPHLVVPYKDKKDERIDDQFQEYVHDFMTPALEKVLNRTIHGQKIHPSHQKKKQHCHYHLVI